MVNKILLCCLFFLKIQLLTGQNTDIDLLKNINQGSAYDGFFKVVSSSASPLSVAVPLGLFAGGFLKKDKSRKEKALYIGATLLTSTLLATGTKYAVRRDRPFVTYPKLINKKTEGSSPSFPSGHTSVAFATATSLSLAYPKWYVAVPAFAWAGSVGYSRMYLGVHYPSDVLAGAAIGAGSAYLCWWLQRQLFAKRLTKEAASLAK